MKEYWMYKLRKNADNDSPGFELISSLKEDELAAVLNYNCEIISSKKVNMKVSEW